MPLPPVTTIAACGSILTACKSAWELSRMIKKKDQEKRLDTLARTIIRELRRSHLDGHMDQKTFDKWYDRLLGAIAEKDAAEMQKIQAHLSFIRRDKGSTRRRSSHSHSHSSTSRAYVDEKETHRHRTRSVDRSRSRVPPAVCTVEEYEEEKRRPNRLDTVKAQRDYYYSHALPSPYRGEIEYTPQTDRFEDLTGSDRRGDQDRRSRHGGGHRRDRHGGSSGSHAYSESYRSRSSSTAAERGRTRSRSVHTESRVDEMASSSPSDADSEPESYFDRRRSTHGGSRGVRSGVH